MIVEDPSKYFREHHGLHDARIERFAFDREKRELLVDLADLYGGWADKEHPCTLILKGVTALLFDLQPWESPRFSDVEILVQRDGLRFRGAMACAGGTLTEGWSFNATFKTLEVKDRKVEGHDDEDR